MRRTRERWVPTGVRGTDGTPGGARRRAFRRRRTATGHGAAAKGDRWVCTGQGGGTETGRRAADFSQRTASVEGGRDPADRRRHGARSEEHTSELQSLRHLVCRL